MCLSRITHSTEPGPGLGSIIIGLHEHTHSCPFNYVYTVITHIYIEDMRTKKVSECAVTFERSVLVKIANSNFMPTLRGSRWYLGFFVAQEQLVAFEASK